ncbi:MAG: sigma-70 family RNA polymerase sigma factor [Planctomycetes bacterium]|nr:sigma-70 family RNA polymerase sigma factor [Planctomycetota bacterium]
MSVASDEPESRLPESEPRPRADALDSRLHAELHELARARLKRAAPGQSIQATALVHEAWIKLKGDPSFPDRERFFEAAARAMKDVLVERLRARLAQKRGGGREPLAMEEVERIAFASAPNLDLLALDEALRALERQHPEESSVVLRRFFAGQTIAEIARDLGASERTIDRRWRFARAFLARHLEAPLPDVDGG